MNNDFYIGCFQATLFLSKNSGTLFYIKTQNDELCMSFVKKNPFSIKHVINQTEAIQLCAVSKYITSIAFIKNPTDSCLKLAEII